MNNELYHHGILGQKWGVRRYQNADGTLTSAGKRRYGEDSKKSEKANKSDKLSTKEKAKNVAIKGARIYNTISTASLLDDVFYGGAGKRAIKTGASFVARMAAQAVMNSKNASNGKSYMDDVIDI